MISWYVTQASSYAADVDHLFLLIAVIVGAFFLAAEFVLLGLIVKFRARPGVKARYITGEKASETRWVNYPHYLVLVFDILIVVAALRVWSDVKIDLPPAEERVRIIAQQWAWTFVHAGPDGRLDTADDIRTVNVLNLQVNRLYHFELHSKDTLHSFSVPAFRLKQDAVPGRAIVGWFRPTVIGEFDLQCAEICGIGHGLMAARVRIRSAAAQAAWMETAPRMPPALSERSESNGQLAGVTPAAPPTLRETAGPKGPALQISGPSAPALKISGLRATAGPKGPALQVSAAHREGDR